MDNALVADPCSSGTSLLTDFAMNGMSRLTAACGAVVRMNGRLILLRKGGREKYT